MGSPVLQKADKQPMTSLKQHDILIFSNMKCQICNEKKHPHGAKYCHACGEPLKNSNINANIIWEILLLAVILVLAIVTSLSEIFDIQSDGAYYAVFGNAALMIMNILLCYSYADEDTGLPHRLLFYIVTAVLMAFFYALAFYLIDIWSIVIQTLLFVIISPFMEGP